MINTVRNLPIRYQALLLLMVLFSLYGVFDHFFDGILPIHEWRKTDSLSIALNYSKGTPFLEPQTQWISANGTRNAAAEFPIIYFILGKLWQVFGHYDWMAKALSISILFISISLFSEVMEFLFEQKGKALLFVFLLTSSPVLLFYADSLLPNVSAFAFVLLGAYGTFKFIRSKHLFWLVFLTVFFALAVLIKITALICLLSFGGAYFFFALTKQSHLFKSQSYFWLLFLLSFLLILAACYLWYSYAIRYNERVHSDLFSTTVRPIWEVDEVKRKAIWQKFWQNMLPGLYHPSMLLLSMLIFGYSAWKKWIHSYVIWLVIIGFLGLVSYFFLWFWVFDVHDYYLIEMLFFPPVLFFVLIQFGSRITHSQKKQRILYASLIALAFAQAISLSHWSFGKNNKLARKTPFVSQYVKDLWGFYHFYHGENLGQLKVCAKDIQQIIPQNDTILCLSDPSPNIYLYTLERIGYTQLSFHEPFHDETEQITQFIRKGASFALVIHDSVWEPRKDWEPFLTRPVYQNGNVYLFDLRHFH